MCGIAGVLAARPIPEERIVRMIDSLNHRGPDDRGIWTADGISLGHARLSVLDVSSAAQQPMTLNHLTMVYNGEVYNFRELRAELVGHGYLFRSTGDSEVVLAAIHFWGIQEAVNRFVGMFAIALWNSQTSVLSLIRDRIGIKPLCYSAVGDTFYFASDLKAIATVNPNLTIRRDALAAFLRHGYIPAPTTIYSECSKLLPGCIATVQVKDSHVAIETEAYWTVPQPSQFEGASDDEYLNILEGRIETAVTRRMISDVPLGAFLSGGIDSSLVASYMQASTNTRIRTFSIGFEDPKFDESGYAREVARAIGTEHVSLTLKQTEVLDLVDESLSVFDEPFGDNSQIPMLLVSRLAREHVTVVLSGDGGDELFGGYKTYAHAELSWSRISRFPKSIRERVERANLARLFGFSSRLSMSIIKLNRILSASSKYDMYYRLVSTTSHPELLLLSCEQSAGSDRFLANDELSYLQWMQRADIHGYLPDDILTKVDRTSMSVGLEARVPLLDHQVVELAMQAPKSMSLVSGEGKIALKKLLFRRLPASLFERPKKGFSIPISDWIRGPLREWVETGISPHRLISEGFFDNASVQKLWNEHLSQKADWGRLIWNIAIFQHWLRRRKDDQQTA